MPLGDLNIVVSAQVSGATAGLQQVEKTLGAVERATGRATNATRHMANQFDHTKTKTQKFAMGALQQAGYQFGDFAVQVANGTSAAQAFGQQGSQLLGIFGPIGAVLGAGVAIFSAFAVAAERSGKTVKSLKDTLNDASAALDRYISLTSSASDVAADFFANAKQMAEANSTTLRDLIAIEKNKAFDAILKLNKAIYGTIQASGFWNTSANENLTSLLGIGNTSAQTRKEIFALEQSFVALNRASTLEDSYNAATRVRDQLLALVDPVNTTNTRLRDFYEQLLLSIQKMELLGATSRTAFAESLTKVKGLAEEAKKAAAATTDLNKVIFDPRDPNFDPVIAEFARLQAGVKAAREEVESLDRSVNRIANIRAQIAKSNELVFDPRDPRYNKFRALMAQIAEETDKAGSAATKTGGALKQMADGVDPLKSMFDDLDTQVKSVTNVLQTGFTNAFMSIFDNTKSAKEKFKDMARYMIAELYKVLVVQQLVGSFDAKTGKGTGLLNFIMTLGKRAQGGPVTAGRPYLVGERGPELIVPSRNATVLPNGSGAGGGVTVNQNITFGSGVSRAEIQQMLPKIVETTKAAVFDAQRRSVGGRGYA